ncbi:hypothetical protein C8Q79DRAFT_1008621 [Trametes meyenii]|nr:hypothetical protein C8Q79DRAFT_1008621 [Trametes meyenii]
MPPPTVERKPSTTFQRVRKLSNTIIHVAKRTVSSTNLRTTASTQQSSAQPSRLRRKVSVDEIGKPRLDPRYSLDGWIAHNDTQQPRPASARPQRPSADECQPVIPDPARRDQEREWHKAANAAKRPERPREEDLPYGAKGSVPIRGVSESALGLSLGSSAQGSGSRTAVGTAVHFPSTRPYSTDLLKDAWAVQRESESDARRGFPLESTGRATFSPFAPIVRQPSTRADVKIQGEGTGKTCAPRSSPHVVPLARSEVKGKARTIQQLREEEYASQDLATVRRQGAIRRPSRASDAALPPQHFRDRFGRSEETLARRPSPAADLLQRSQSMATRRPLNMRPAGAQVPSSPLAREQARARPKPRDVPRDVEPREAYSMLLLDDSSSDFTESAESIVIAPGRTAGAGVSGSEQRPPAPQRAPRPHRPMSEVDVDPLPIPTPNARGLAQTEPGDMKGAGHQHSSKSAASRRTKMTVEVHTYSALSQYHLTGVWDEVARNLMLPDAEDAMQSVPQSATEPLRPKKGEESARKPKGSKENGRR